MKDNSKILGAEASVAQDLRANMPTAGRRLVALTKDRSLALVMEELANHGYDVTQVEDTESLSSELLQATGSIALLDATTLPEAVESLVDALSAQFPDLRLLVAGHSATQHQLATRIGSGKVFRFVHLPVSAQRLKLMVDAANRPLDLHRVSSTQTFEIPAELRQLAAESSISATPPGKKAFDKKAFDKKAFNWMWLALSVVTVSIAAWFLWPEADNRSTSISTAPQAALPDPVDELMRQAQRAFAEGRYVTAQGPNAAAMYAEVLALNPNHAEARSGYDRSIDLELRRAEQAMLAEKIDEAASIASSLAPLAAGNSRFQFLEAQIAKERTRLKSADAMQRSQEQRQSDLLSRLAQMEEQLQRNAQVSTNPTPNSPASATNPNVPAATTTAPALAPPVLAPSAPAASSASAADDSAANPSGAESQGAANSIVAESSLRRIFSPPPEYPSRALQLLQSGWVDLAFTVAADGSVRDISVTQAEPARMFNAAAMAALRRWRYDPVIRDGQAVSQRARMRMRFTAQDGGKGN